MERDKRIRGGERSGFTMVEMLVIIGIIGVLSAVLLSSFGHVRQSARKAQAQALVNEAAMAFTRYLQEHRSWAEEMLSREDIDEEICGIFQEGRYLDVTTYEIDKNNRIRSPKVVNENSLDRFGLLDPWGQHELKRSREKKNANTKMSNGRSFKDHRLQYRLDKNLDGFVDGGEGSPQTVKVRASVLVWSRGPDGLDDFDQGGRRYPFNDSLSWPHAQYRRSN